MLSLNIIDQDYMCIDIATDSVIHQQIVNKLFSLSEDGLHHGWGTPEYYDYNPILGTAMKLESQIEQNVYNDISNGRADHGLTMLDRFHINLGKPPQTEEEKEEFKYYDSKELCHMDIVPIIGDITLAPICVSEKDGKKSAWVPLNPHWICEAFRYTFDPSAYIDYELNLDQFDSFDHRCDECPVKHLHVSVANLTGKPRDNISRPEDCIIDTITA